MGRITGDSQGVADRSFLECLGVSVSSYGVDLWAELESDRSIVTSLQIDTLHRHGWSIDRNEAGLSFDLFSGTLPGIPTPCALDHLLRDFEFTDDGARLTQPMRSS